MAESNLSTETNLPWKDAYFDFDKSDLRADARQALTEDAGLLKAHPGMKVELDGHCDVRGSEEYNLGLGDRRATAAKDFLVSLGVAASQIATVSYGKDRPYCTEAAEDCYQQNRRAHVVVR